MESDQKLTKKLKKNKKKKPRENTHLLTIRSVFSFSFTFFTQVTCTVYSILVVFFTLQSKFYLDFSRSSFCNSHHILFLINTIFATELSFTGFFFYSQGWLINEWIWRWLHCNPTLFTLFASVNIKSLILLIFVLLLFLFFWLLDPVSGKLKAKDLWLHVYIQREFEFCYTFFLRFGLDIKFYLKSLRRSSRKLSEPTFNTFSKWLFGAKGLWYSKWVQPY